MTQRMTWTQEFQAACKDARSLSDIEDFSELVKLADNVGQDLNSGGVSSRQLRVLLSETTRQASAVSGGEEPWA